MPPGDIRECVNNYSFAAAVAVSCPPDVALLTKSANQPPDSLMNVGAAGSRSQVRFEGDVLYEQPYLVPGRLEWRSRERHPGQAGKCPLGE